MMGSYRSRLDLWVVNSSSSAVIKACVDTELNHEVSNFKLVLVSDLLQVHQQIVSLSRFQPYSYYQCHFSFQLHHPYEMHCLGHLSSTLQPPFHRGSTPQTTSVCLVFLIYFNELSWHLSWHLSIHYLCIWHRNCLPIEEVQMVLAFSSTLKTPNQIL